MAKKKNQATMLRTFLLVTAIFAVSALAMAGLLTYYGKVVGTARVEQAVLVDGKDYTEEIEESFSVKGGESYGPTTHYIQKQTSVNAKIKITKSIIPPTGTDASGVSVEYLLETPNEQESKTLSNQNTIELNYEIADKNNDNEVNCEDVTINDLPNGVSCSSVSGNRITLSDTVESATVTVTYNALKPYTEGSTVELTTNDKLTLKILYSFAVNIVPGSYTITTFVEPVTSQS